SCNPPSWEIPRCMCRALVGASIDTGQCLCFPCKERQKGLSAFERMQTALDESKCSWLYCLDDLGKKMEKNWVENSAELLNHITDFSSLIAKLEEKCQQPAGEFLQSLERFHGEIHGQAALGGERNFAGRTGICVTLDQDTAHCCLSVSENQRSVKGGRKLQSRSSRPEQFDIMPCVLGCEKFTAERHYWDVEVEGDEGQWVVGVARESIKRKGNINFSPEEGIWAIQYPFGFILKFKTLMAPLQILKGSLEPLSKIRVSLNYEAGRVSFSDACTGTSIFTFSSACFSGERVYPFFLVSQGTTLNCC
uniref:B30.2/SPRY domain-containing protein n=1 Tax=Salvator merianae TaxID=96440 RepID=A0A8D0BNG3_SALMN